MNPGATVTGTPNIWGRPVALQSAITNPYDTDRSTADTIVIMRRLAHGYASDQSVCVAVAEALSRGAVTDRDVACAIFWWIRRNVTFIEDETLLFEQLGIAADQLDKELLIPPPVLLAMPQPMGDCDDFSLLGASMLLSAGLRPYFVTVAADPMTPDKFSHIYICVYLRDEQTHLCLDPGNRLPMVPPGWESSKVSRKAVWTV